MNVIRLPDGWALIDGEQRCYERPDVFEIPPLSDRLAAEINTFVKIGVENKLADGGLTGERCWVLIVAKVVDDKEGNICYVGRVSNKTVINVWKYGDNIAFEPRNILALNEKD
jgi:hypothetical protein